MTRKELIEQLQNDLEHRARQIYSTDSYQRVGVLYDDETGVVKQPDFSFSFDETVAVIRLKARYYQEVAL